jgi:hypothetical protein
MAKLGKLYDTKVAQAAYLRHYRFADSIILYPYPHGIKIISLSIYCNINFILHYPSSM